MHDYIFDDLTPVDLKEIVFEEHVVYDAEGHCWTWSF